MAKEQAYHFKTRIDGRLIPCFGKGQDLSKRSVRISTPS